MNITQPDLPDDLDGLLDLPDLDDLLGTAKAEAKDKADLKASKARLAKGGLSDREREEDIARVRAWEAKNLYKAVANVACFTEARCAGCESYSYLFTGLMERSVHRHIETTQRYIAVDVVKTDLDNEVMVTRKVTPFCVDCMGAVGFTFNNAYTEDGEELKAADDTDEQLADEADETDEAELQEEQNA